MNKYPDRWDSIPEEQQQEILQELFKTKKEYARASLPPEFRKRLRQYELDTKKKNS